MKSGIEIIAQERGRHRYEGFGDSHDDDHVHSEMAIAAACYALPRILRPKLLGMWPWDHQWWKPTPDDRVRELAKAGALIAAEIDRLQRCENAEAAADEAFERERLAIGLPGRKP